MQKNYCKNCVHYQKHYYWTEKGFDLIDCGHCDLEDVSLKVESCDKYESISRDEISKRLKEIEDKINLIIDNISKNYR